MSIELKNLQSLVTVSIVPCVLDIFLSSLTYFLLLFYRQFGLTVVIIDQQKRISETLFHSLKRTMWISLMLRYKEKELHILVVWMICYLW